MACVTERALESTRPKPDVDDPLILQRGFSEVIRSKWWRGKLEGCPCWRCANEAYCKDALLAGKTPYFVLHKGIAIGFLKAIGFRNKPKRTISLTFGVVTPVCSFDMAEVPPEWLCTGRRAGEMYFLQRALSLSMGNAFVTNPRRSEEQKRIACELTMPSGEKRKFNDFIEAAPWSAANALQGDSNPWLANGTTVT